MLDPKKSSSIAETVRDTTGATLLAGALALGIQDLTAKYYPVGNCAGGLCGAAFGDMGTGCSRVVVEEAREELAKAAAKSDAAAARLADK